MKKIWTAKDTAIASRMGWNLFRIDIGSRKLEIEREDEQEIFDDDNEAIEYVLRHAKTSKTCRKALNVVYGI